MKQFLMIVAMAVLMSTSSSVYSQQIPQSDDFDKMADVIGSKSKWVWHPSEQLLMLCFTVQNIREALCTSVPTQYRVTKTISSQPTLVIPNGSDIQL